LSMNGFRIGYAGDQEAGRRSMRFDELIRAGMTVREVKVNHPDTVEVFEKLGFRDSCDDCSIESVCRKMGLASQEVVDRLTRAAFRLA